MGAPRPRQSSNAKRRLRVASPRHAAAPVLPSSARKKPCLNRGISRHAYRRTGADDVAIGCRCCGDPEGHLAKAERYRRYDTPSWVLAEQPGPGRQVPLRLAGAAVATAACVLIRAPA